MIKTYSKPYISTARIGLQIYCTWKNSINETPTPLLQEVSNSHKITNLNSLLKYILCYCSTQTEELISYMIFNLNTSYVTVQLDYLLGFYGDNIEFKYILCYCSTIQEANATRELIKFKYILCYCSTKNKQRRLIGEYTV